jgi:mRNA interferase RelE/StbE
LGVRETLMYEILFASSAVRDYKKLPDRELPAINDAIDALADNPRPQGYRKLKDRDAYRIRVGDYRIIYEIEDKKVTVLVIRIKHRREVYRNL